MKILDKFTLILAGIFAILFAILSILNWYDDWDFMQRCMERHKDITKEAATEHCQTFMAEIRAIK